MSPEFRETLTPPTAGTYGLQRRARQIHGNRKDFASGRISLAETEARGGLVVAGNLAFPVFPVLYANTEEPPFPKQEIEKQLFTGPWATGTLREYYLEISYGNFSVSGVVDNWFTLGEDDTYYEGGNWGFNEGPVILAFEVLTARDPVIDFAAFDNDGADGIPNSGDDDGYADAVVFLHPEVDGVCDKYVPPICGTVGQSNSNIWAHKRELSDSGDYFETDDPSNAPGVPFIRVDWMLIAGALTCDDTQNGIAVFAHELGHILDIADLYDTVPGGVNPDAEGIGRWGLMGTGTWNTPDEPAHMIAWCKERLGWLEYFNVTQDLSMLCVPPVETHPVAVRLWSQGEESSEYFLVENRQPIGFDANLLGRGLVIYHVDEDVYDAKDGSNQVNATESHKAIDIECADASTAEHVSNADDLDDRTNCGDATDPWCPLSQDEFDGASVPDSRSYDNNPTGVAVRNIDSCTGGADGIVCATFEVGVAFQADLCMVDCAADGCDEITTCDVWWASPDIWLDQDDDGVDDHPAEGLKNKLHYRVKNVGPEEIAGVTVDLFYRVPGTGLYWPETGTLISSEIIPEVIPVNETYEGSVLFTYPVPPPGVDHYCLGAVVHHDLDPQNSLYPPNDNNVCQVNHQVLVERAEGGALATCGGSFTKVSAIEIYARSIYGRQLMLRLGTPPDFADWSVPGNWNLDYDPGPWILLPGEVDTVEVTMSSPSAQHGETARVPLTLWDVQNEKAVGGVFLDYRIDCFNPLAPENLRGACLPYHGDELDGPTVRLDFDKVIEDSDGTEEVVKFYRVYRSDNQGSPEALVGEVAIDAEPEMAGFQWYDTVPPLAGVVYTYRVRAVDAADNVGPHSSPTDIECDFVVSAAAPETDGARRLGQNRPNPAGRTTTIPFRLAEPAWVTLEVFDPAGRRVRILADGRYDAGAWNVEWDGTGEDGGAVAPGVYVYRLSTGERSEVRKLIRVE
jgi:M6 family metalloprotease-like protein